MSDLRMHLDEAREANKRLVRERDEARADVERLKARHASDYETLRAFDTYGTGDIAACVREVTLRLSEAREEVERLKAESKLLRHDADKEWGACATALESLRERCAAAAFDMAVANTGPMTTDAIEAAVRAVPLES